MQQCPNCGHQNRAGVVYCENCGASLFGKMPLDTKSLGTTISDDQPETGIDSSVLTDVKVQGISSFTPGDMLRLEIEGSPEPVLFEPKAEAVFGRRDPATGAIPDIDLTPFAGYRMGVSRRHAAIRQNSEQSLDLWDLGSSNGTYLNGQRLSAHRPYRLHNGDEIRLGQMLIRVSFESGVLAPRTKQEQPDAKTPVAATASTQTLDQPKQEKAEKSAASAPVEAAPAAKAPDVQKSATKDVVAPPTTETAEDAGKGTSKEPSAPQAAPTDQPADADAAAPTAQDAASPGAGSGTQPEAPAPEQQAEPQSAAEPASVPPATDAEPSDKETPEDTGSTDKEK